MLPDRVSNPGPLTYELGALPIALRGPALCNIVYISLLITLSQGRFVLTIEKAQENGVLHLSNVCLCKEVPLFSLLYNVVK